VAVSRHHNAGQNYHLLTANKSFGNVAEFKYLGTTVSIHEEMKSTLNSWNACYHSIQRFFSSCVFSKNMKIKLHKTIILPVSYGCGTWSLTLTEEHGLSVLGNRVPRRIFGPKKEELAGEDGIMRSFITCTLHQILLG
jgi:hypothetical protein